MWRAPPASRSMCLPWPGAGARVIAGGRHPGPGPAAGDQPGRTLAPCRRTARFCAHQLPDWRGWPAQRAELGAAGGQRLHTAISVGSTSCWRPPMPSIMSPSPPSEAPGGQRRPTSSSTACRPPTRSPCWPPMARASRRCWSPASRRTVSAALCSAGRVGCAPIRWGSADRQRRRPAPSGAAPKQWRPLLPERARLHHQSLPAQRRRRNHTVPEPGDAARRLSGEYWGRICTSRRMGAFSTAASGPAAC